MYKTSNNDNDFSSPLKRKCATVEAHHQLLKESAEYATARANIEASYTQNIHAERAMDRSVVSIPVIVHVVWNTPEQNTSDEKVHSQIEVLNRDFRKLNPDVSKVPPVWQHLVADAKVEFHLTDKDPNGNPTTGITRTQTSKTSFSHIRNDVKSSVTGGMNAWPSDRYLNLRVCGKLTGGS